MNLEIDSNKSEFTLKSYDLIAIDMDNTLVKYNLKNFLPLIHRLIQKLLVEKYNYPKDICEEFCPKLCQKGLVIDRSRGNILKLDSDFRIISAKHGFKELSEDEVRTTYGTICGHNRLKQIVDFLSMYSIASTDCEFYVCKDYFTSASAQVMAKTVEVMDQINTSSAPNVDYGLIWNHIYQIMCFMYDKNGFKLQTGRYFEELTANPDKYLERSPEEVKQLLKDLRKSGKLVFLITSSNVDYMRFLMDYSFGKHWINYFDCCVTFARKPTFFTTDRKFLSIDSNDLVQNSVAFDELKCGQIYSEGNWNDLKSFAAKQSSKPSPMCLYIGDSFNDDCIVPKVTVDCDTIAIVEELEEEVRPELEPTYWQSFFKDNQNNFTLWHQLLQKHSKLMVSKFEDLVKCF